MPHCVQFFSAKRMLYFFSQMLLVCHEQRGVLKSKFNIIGGVVLAGLIKGNPYRGDKR